MSAVLNHEGRLKLHEKHFEQCLSKGARMGSKSGPASSCAACVTLLGSGEWSVTAAGVKGRDDFVCSHYGCDYYSISSRTSTRKQAVERHEEAFPIHGHHYMRHGQPTSSVQCGACRSRDWSKDAEEWMSKQLQLWRRLSTKEMANRPAFDVDSLPARIVAHYRFTDTRMVTLVLQPNVNRVIRAKKAPKGGKAAVAAAPAVKPRSRSRGPRDLGAELTIGILSIDGSAAPAPLPASLKNAILTSVRSVPVTLDAAAQRKVEQAGVDDVMDISPAKDAIVSVPAVSPPPQPFLPPSNAGVPDSSPVQMRKAANALFGFSCAAFVDPNPIGDDEEEEEEEAFAARHTGTGGIESRSLTPREEHPPLKKQKSSTPRPTLVVSPPRGRNALLRSNSAASLSAFRRVGT